MCGIVGYIGDRDAVPVLLNGLKNLEYRGYDSSGIAVCGNDGINIRKREGRLLALERALDSEPLRGSLGIGHTRWATHGEPSDRNAHPHAGGSNIAVAHNGIIENYMELKKELEDAGYVFASETDTEVLAHYIDYCDEGDLRAAVLKVLQRIRGSYAFVAVSKKEPDRLVCVRKENPLIVGVGNGENFAASDIPAILEHTRSIYLLDENELAVIKKDTVRFYDHNGIPVAKAPQTVSWDAAAAEKGAYDHFMLKEIHEQPKAVRDTLLGRVLPGVPGIVCDQFKLTKAELTRLGKIQIVACGTAYHAGLVGKHVIETLAGIPVEVKIASEFRYNCPLTDARTLTVAISQSGESLDTLMSLKEAKKKGSRILSIVNVVGSSATRASDDVLYTRAGPEIAVAATKTFLSQLTALYVLALFLAELKETMAADDIEAFKRELLAIPDVIDGILRRGAALRRFALDHADARDFYFLGRGLDYVAALEGALKLKELSYIHAEAFPAGELKHGPIALIEKGTPVLALLTQENLSEKMISNIREVKARGAFVYAIAREGMALTGVADEVFTLPKVSDLLSPLAAVVPLQLLAYYMAVERGCDVDKPRNLAKSVTVE
jgi:glucosamine--fructose-6-phosphate aminotransferase (isomerizing)